MRYTPAQKAENEATIVKAVALVKATAADSSAELVAGALKKSVQTVDRWISGSFRPRVGESRKILEVLRRVGRSLARIQAK